MLKRLLPLALLFALTTSTVEAQALRGEVLYRTTLMRAAPGRLLDLITALRARGLAAAESKALVLRHAQGDHWDLMVLQPIASYAEAFKNPGALALAPGNLVAWQEDEFVRGPDIDALPGFREANLYHAELFHALPGKRAELLKERETENAYAGLLGRPQTAIFVRELGASWDSFTIGWYRGWKHYAEREDIPKEKSATAAKAAGFPSQEEISPYLRSLILDHHDSLLSPVR